jgi:hypothetical protein
MMQNQAEYDYVETQDGDLHSSVEEEVTSDNGSDDLSGDVSSNNQSDEIELLIDDENIMGDDESNHGSPEEEDESEEKSKKETEEDGPELKYDPEENLDKKFVIKHNGKLIETDLKELKMLAQKGIDYSAKTMKLSGYKEMIDTLEQYGVKSIDELNQLIKNPELAEQGLEKVESNPAEDIASQILAQPNAEQFREVVVGLPDTAKELLSKDANTLGRFYNDFSVGVAQKLIPETTKIMALRPEVDFISAYKMAGDKILGKAKHGSRKKVQEPSNSFSDFHDDITDDSDYKSWLDKMNVLE